MAVMKTVGLRQLKSRLSEYLRAVQEGECVRITNRGTVVAELVPPNWSHAVRQQGGHPGSIDLWRRGLATLGGANDAALYPEMPPPMVPGRTAQLLDDAREER